jgi:lipopolysaccharide transport system ATP-binding protein
MAANVVIRVEDLKKRYQLGEIGGGTLSDELRVWWARMRGRPNPLVTVDKEDGQRSGSDFWALRGASFEVREGEVLGIIGRNGAGKSTLLKLLSRITAPTEGVIRMKGRVSSLLEVGTGFNPELTGRDNIYLNGAILGMRKEEIDTKLQDIIAFSGIQHHIDTPVKRYSSGMKVRLGFSVAAHLEPEVLIIDEVLAVGDADFQRKCMGKMKDVSRSGRTILFVSHNMASVRSLCTRVLWLQDGMVKMDGDTDEVVNAYLSDNVAHVGEVTWKGSDRPGTAEVVMDRVAVVPAAEGLLTWRTSFDVAFEFTNHTVPEGELSVGMQVLTEEGIIAFASSNRETPDLRFGPGRRCLKARIPGDLLNIGEYRITVIVRRPGGILFTLEEVLSFEVHDTERTSAWFGRSKGVFHPVLQWRCDPVGPA